MGRPGKGRSDSGMDRHDCWSEQTVANVGENAHREVEKGDTRGGISKPREFENKLMHDNES